MISHEASGLLLIERALLLKSLSVFTHTPEPVLAEIATLMQEEEVAANTNIVTEGEPGSCMYIIFKGSVSVHTQQKQLATLGEKDFFGELSLLDTEARSATVTALEDSILFRIDQEPFFDLLEQQPDVLRGIIKILCTRLRAANKQISELKGGG